MNPLQQIADNLVAWAFEQEEYGEWVTRLSLSREAGEGDGKRNLRPLYAHPARGVVDEAMVRRALDAFGWLPQSVHPTCEQEAKMRAALQAAALPAVPAFDMLAHLQRQREWSGRTFGPGPRTAGVIDHIRKELREIEADPTDLSEWIDVVILALDGAWRAGGTPEQIIATLVAKQTKNEGRTWPDWRTVSPDKAIEHDRTQDALPAVPDGYEVVCALELARLRERAKVEQMAVYDDSVWYWQGDGQDIPASLSCPVIMSADTLRSLLAATQAHDQPEGSDND